MQLARITVFPIKSLDGLDVERAALTACGALVQDRRFALFDRQGRYLNGKRRPDIHQIRTRFLPDRQTLQSENDLTSVELSAPGRTAVEVPLRLAPLADWFTDYFGEPVTVREDGDRGFPDDGEAWGPTLISTATLELLATWFPGLAVADLRRRLRTNLEVTAAAPFAEDALFAEPGQEVLFRIGRVTLAGSNPCARCVVPTRDPLTGERYADFQKILAARRQETLDATVAKSRFDHFYRVALNTRVDFSQAGQQLAVGDPLERLRVRQVS